MDFKGKNVLILGINGFVGAAAARKFLSMGAHVIGLVRDFNRKTDEDLLRECSVVQGDLLDKDKVQRIVSHYEVDYILHLASQAIVSICDQDPYTAYQTNIMGTVNVMEACRNLTRNMPKVIVMVSDKYYGSTNELPYTEDLSPEVADTYCTSKTCQDFITRSYAKTYGVPAMTVRAGNIYGPGDLNLSRLIPKNIIKLHQGKSPVLYSHASVMVREFLYIDDVLSGFITLFDKGEVGEAYNFGGTLPRKVGDVMDLMVKRVNPDVEVELVPTDFYEISEQYLDATKMGKLGWFPQYELEEGLDETILYYTDLVDTKKVLL